MFTYQVRLSPKPGNPGGNITVTTDSEATT
jgi:hypothetical protein